MSRWTAPACRWFGPNWKAAPDGQARTREGKLAAFFTQTATDAEGHPLRDPDRGTHLASLVGSDQFGPLARRAALQRGMAPASQLIYLGDGAAWV